MGRLKLEAEERVEATTVSNLFIDRYMPRANGEYIKIYLMLLRYFQTPESDLSVTALADFLECTEKDVHRGLNYWEKQGVVSLFYDGEKKLSGVRLKDLQGSTAFGDVPEKQAVTERRVERETAATYTSAKPFSQTDEAKFSLEQLAEDEAFSQLLSIVSAYKKKPLSREDCNIFAYLYEALGMSADLLEYLAETCVESGYTSVRTMEKIALEWHERGIKTPEQAEAMQTVYRQDMWKIMKAFGLTKRNPNNSEKKMMEKWLMQYGFDLDVIIEACDRTVFQIHEPSFPYADKILSSWKKSGVRTKSDIEQADQSGRLQREKERAERTAANTDRAGKSSARPNRFHNYQQRDTDYDSLVAQNDPLMAEAINKFTKTQKEE
ncbi:MAG: DnaD domain protein [Lachnospiraceae bacterium]|nr:DnaD domain protein [Lachnospiraceae bacterium]